MRSRLDTRNVWWRRGEWVLRASVSRGRNPRAHCAGESSSEACKLRRAPCSCHTASFFETLLAREDLPAADTESPAISTWLTANKVHLNKVEMDNLRIHFPGTAAGTVDLAAFFGACAVDERGRPPVFLPIAVDSEHNAHLALSGKSSMIFGEQYKPYPQHWGPPPNMQMKGHAGVVRDLPGGYGKGNESMEKWVRKNMEHDKRTLTNVNGVSKYPLGNYSL